MSTLGTQPQTRSERFVPARAAPGEPRRARPVKGFALLGAVWVAVLVYEWASWLADGDAHASPIGPSRVPQWQKIAALSWEIAMIVGAIGVVSWFIVRPWRRERRLTLDGMLVIVWIVMWATQDSWANYSQQYFNYNSVFWNLGCPQCHAPGWQSHGGKFMAEPIVFTGGMYVTSLFLGTILTCAAMRWARRRWPAIGTLGLIAFAYAFILVVDFAMELPWLRFGLYSYSGSIRSVSFFAGHYYQFPIYEGLLWGAAWASFGCLRFFVDDRGRTIAQRGIDGVRGRGWQKTGLELLALIGVMQTLFLVLCNAPTAMLALHGDAYPRDVLDKSYLTNHMCGLGTSYACPDPRIPAPLTSQSGYVTPAGTFVAPHGLPVQVHARR